MLSIDPGSYVTGLAFWEDFGRGGYELIDARTVVAGRRLGFARRNLVFLEFLEIAGKDFRPSVVACERPVPSRDRPAPEAAVLVTSYRQWARRLKAEWKPYAASTVLANIRPSRSHLARQGQPQAGDVKDLIRRGVEMVYGPRWGAYDQDAIDAIAVGHCHDCKEKEAAILAFAGIAEAVLEGIPKAIENNVNGG